MYDIEFPFEEVPLLAGKRANGHPQAIALISGTALVNVYSKGHWDFEEVTLSFPDNESDVTLTCEHPLWDFVTNSIEDHCGDRLWDETLEVCRPDPDARHDSEAAY